MTRLDDLAAQRKWDEARWRYLNAPKGTKQKRQAEVKFLATLFLRQDVSARRKGRRRK